MVHGAHLKKRHGKSVPPVITLVMPSGEERGCFASVLLYVLSRKPRFDYE